MAREGSPSKERVNSRSLLFRAEGKGVYSFSPLPLSAIGDWRRIRREGERVKRGQKTHSGGGGRATAGSTRGRNGRSPIPLCISMEMECDL